jgi:prepilin-type N-terminal cleavage/methylation domain-containing protein
MKFEARILNCLKQKIKFIIHHSPPAIAFAKRWRAGSFIIHPERGFTTFSSHERGFTLVELLVVIGIIGLMSTVSIAILNPIQQLQKSRDTQRKSDLKQIQNALESYSFDTGRYPDASLIVWGADWSPYLPAVPKDPLSPNQEYSYELIDNNTYRLFAKLERCSDPQVNVIGDCKASQFNYSATSSNIASSFIGTASGPIPTPTSVPSPTSVPIPSLDPTKPVVSPTLTPTSAPIPTSAPTNTPIPTALPTLTNAPTPIPIAVGGLAQEAEHSRFSGMTTANDGNASGGRYVWIPQGAGNNPNDDTSGGPEFIEFTFDIPSTKTYAIWARTIAPNGTSDSFYVMLDGIQIQEWHTPQSTSWKWNRIKNQSLNSGLRKITFRKREDGIRLDRVLLAQDTNCTPTEKSGNNCLPSSTPVPQCNDGIDNDGNGCADSIGGDTGCTSVTDSIESGGSCPFVASGCADNTTEQRLTSTVHGCDGSVFFENAQTLCAFGWHVGDLVTDIGLNAILSATAGTSSRFVRINGDPGNGLGWNDNPRQYCWITREPCLGSSSGGFKSLHVPSTPGAQLFSNGKRVLDAHGSRVTFSRAGAICVKN